jgi:hypothetical protein
VTNVVIIMTVKFSTTCHLSYTTRQLSYVTHHFTTVNQLKTILIVDNLLTY